MKISAVGRAARIELGDFQTPPALAALVVEAIARRGAAPRSIFEPTAGRGNLLFAAIDRFASIERAAAVEIDPAHAAHARAGAAARGIASRVQIHEGDVFATDLAAHIEQLPPPLLVIGNPPWVTSARIGAMGGKNLPEKHNLHGYSGLDAVTGKSNFDVSEWILLALLSALAAVATPGQATLAMLCKEGVARRVLKASAARRIPVRRAAMYAIDAREHFGAAVRACLFVCDLGEGEGTCDGFEGLSADRPSRRLSFSSAGVISDEGGYAEVRHLEGVSPIRWRSGIKHDRSRLMELRRAPGGGFENGAGEPVDIEEDHVYPLLKSSDLARGRVAENRLWMLVPQRHTGDDPRALLASSPRSFAYLESHREAFRRRASSIYRGRPDYAIFGVGSYTFASHKVAVSGLHESVDFALVGPIQQKPVVFDDTSYFLPCEDEIEAKAIFALLSTAEAKRYFGCRIFRGDKRPVTKELLDSLDLGKLARHAGGRAMAEARGSPEIEAAIARFAEGAAKA
jgi:hypothetical protein